MIQNIKDKGFGENWDKWLELGKTIMHEVSWQ